MHKGVNGGSREVGLGRRARSASCRRHTSHLVAVNRSHSLSATRHQHHHHHHHSGNPLFSSSRRLNSVSTSSNSHHYHHYRSHRQQAAITSATTTSATNPASSSSHHHHQHRHGGSSASSRRGSSSNKRYMWAVEQMVGSNLSPSRTRASHHHQYVSHCAICARQHALYLAAAQIHNSSSGGGGGERGGELVSSSSQLAVGEGVHGGAGYCRLCHQQQRRSSESAPKHSMVLFTEPQGGFITIPLTDKDQYNPVNRV